MDYEKKLTQAYFTPINSTTTLNTVLYARAETKLTKLKHFVWQGFFSAFDL